MSIDDLLKGMLGPLDAMLDEVVPTVSEGAVRTVAAMLNKLNDDLKAIMDRCDNGEIQKVEAVDEAFRAMLPVIREATKVADSAVKVLDLDAQRKEGLKPQPEPANPEMN